MVRGALALGLMALPGAAQAECFLALALALDVSASVDAREYALQRDGTAAALLAPEVQRAMFARPGAWLALAVYEWSGRWQQGLVLDWQEIRTPEDLAAAAASVAAAKRSFSEFPTAVGYALGHGAGLLERAPPCIERKIDISGDGINNEGFSPGLAYRHFDFEGITVNGLVIEGGNERVTDFYRMEVIRGPGAFVEITPDYEGFETAMRRKLVREIGVVLLGSADGAR
ncbi:MAG: hypothetical protein CVT80_03945 [Alphaproteobacteria bacterium HGW-Alphaproteobacteria-2]|nr:MAG: hypothetical protein CVT80_03945 [Alphaproteobacteria bacterium HGW-Alphaproteobacteria-2]